MTTRPYYVLCILDTDQGAWFDEFGSYARDEVRDEMDCYDIPNSRMAVIKTDGSAADMIAKRDALHVPERYRKP